MKFDSVFTRLSRLGNNTQPVHMNEASTFFGIALWKIYLILGAAIFLFLVLCILGLVCRRHCKRRKRSADYGSERELRDLLLQDAPLTSSEEDENPPQLSKDRPVLTGRKDIAEITEGNEEQSCSICHLEVATVAFVPCGHETCRACAAAFVEVLELPACPICELDINSLRSL